MDFEMRNQLSLRNFLHLIFKRKTQITFVFALIIIAVAAGTFLSSPVYEAKSQILVKIGRENVYTHMVPTSGNQSPIIGVNHQEQINSEIEILRSRSMIEKTAKAIGPEVIYKDLATGGVPAIPEMVTLQGQLSPLHEAVLRLEEALSITAVKESNVIDISLRHKEPQIATMVLDKLISLYLSHHIEVHKIPQSYKFFQEQSEIFMSRLKNAEDRLTAMKKEHNVFSLDEARGVLRSQEGSLRVDLDRTLTQIAETENRIGQIQQQLAGTPKVIPTEEEVEHSPVLGEALQTKLVELELKEKELLAKYTDNNRLVQQTREEIKIIRKKLAEQGARQHGRSRSGHNPTFQRLQEDLYRSQADLKALKAKDQIQTSQLGDYGERLGKLNQIEVKLKDLQRQVDVEQQNYKLYLEKFEEARISEAMDTEKISNVTQIQHAEVSPQPVSPRVGLNMAIGFFLAVSVSLGFAFLLETLGDRLEEPDETERALGLPVLASIPEMKKSDSNNSRSLIPSTLTSVTPGACFEPSILDE